jgi:hypothetical protein
MKSHAVPQEIMSMEFKLFGNFMTLREFIFIVAGVAIAWFFYLMMNAGVIPGLLAWPAVVVFGLGGALFGLVPYQDRTLDRWLLNFILAIRKPTQRVWKKPGFEPVTDSEKEIFSLKSQVISPMKSKTKSAKKITSQEDKKAEQQVSLSKIDNTISQVEKGLSPVQRKQTPQSMNNPNINTVKPKTISAPGAPPSQVLPQSNTNIASAKPPIANLKSEIPKPQPVSVTPPNIKGPEKSKTSQTIRNQSQPQIIGNTKQNINPVEQKTGSTLTISEENIQNYAAKESIPNLTQHKNTINIIIKDSSGKILEDVVSVIKNEDGSPIRAAVSNEFGQIINNNPLDNGKYKVTLSKEGLSFPELNIEMKGREYPILEITAQ